MTSWTVYVESGVEATESQVARVGELLEKKAPGSSMAPPPFVGCLVRVDDAPLPTRALMAVQGLLVLSITQALGINDAEIRIRRVKMSTAESEVTHQRLITAKGLAEHFGWSASYVRTRMRFKGAPAPVEIEGGAEYVYCRDKAIAYLEGARSGVEKN
jgi:hypothetical protein